ncbi:uncharacterized protein CDV56_109371 [Aspergillus thermomutatus]|uniref:Peptidase A1 domain-containing protein n=1 Tax=Aspergillus thermomutatus TaxID=41047 RepID=A0A397HP64_ASPTH|nr:uncharacterized protein CDV56_109371 [Aspergillus thermomutatus]RHZ64961.1 hypothetical protein CDV56_109371 [Aspergillus thermomutatus]
MARLACMLVLWAVALLPTTAETLPAVKKDNPAVISAKLRKGSFPSTLQKRDTISAPALSDGSYLMNISIGTPPQPVGMVLDTLDTTFMVMYPGPNTNCSAHHHCEEMGYFDPRNSSTFATAEHNWEGLDDSFDGSDTVTVGGAKLSDVSLGLVTINDPYSYNLLGIGPDNRSFPYQLVDSGLISTPSFSAWRNPNTTNEGEIIFGGINSAKFNAPLHAFSFKDVISFPVHGIQIKLANGITSQTESNSQNSTITSTIPVARFPLYSRYITTNLPRAMTMDLYAALNLSSFQWENGYWPPPQVPCTRRSENHTIAFLIGNSTIPISWSAFLSEEYNDPDTCSFYITPSDDDKGSWTGVLGSLFLSNIYLAVDYNSMMVGIAPLNKNPGSDEILEMGTSSPQIPRAVGDFPPTVTAYAPAPTENPTTETSSGLAAMRTAAPGLLPGVVGAVVLAII